ncbi:MAG: flavodoxin [Rhodobacteraceae bacterium PARR1]|nr:MAG: flavodoxin [Rhodobacteraceae bacterium PARR1]
MRQVLFLCSSARPQGNARLLAERAAAGLGQDVGQDWIDLAALPLPAFHDCRPHGHPPEGALATVWQAMALSTDIVFVAPVYWYALPAPAKLLLDHWSGWLDAPGMGFADRMRGKRLWLITARADPDPTVVAPIEAMLHRAATWLNMAWGGALHGIGDAAGDVLTDADTLSRAPGFFTL